MMLSNIVLAAILSLAQTNPSLKIEFNEGSLETDVAQAKRYMGASYGDTISCVITFDRNNFSKIANEEKNRYIKIDRAKLYDFVLLHELAHCFDGIPEPLGANSVEWREFLADVFGASELNAARAIDENDYRQLIRLRSSHPDTFEINALVASKAFIKTLTVDNSAKRIAAVKQFRKENFSARGFE